MYDRRLGTNRKGRGNELVRDPRTARRIIMIEKKELNVISIQQTTHGHMPPEQTSNFCHLFIKEPSLQLEALRL